MQCEATQWRAELTKAIQKAARPDTHPFKLRLVDGSEEELLQAFEVLSGIVAEWTDGGDQMAEECSCGSEEHRNGHRGETLETILWKRRRRLAREAR